MKYLILKADGCYHMIKEDLVRSINYTDSVILTEKGSTCYDIIMMRTYDFNEGMAKIQQAVEGDKG